MAKPLVRPDLYIVARFLDALYQVPGDAFPKEHTRSRLQAATRLNYDLFRSYLERLIEKGLIGQREGRDGKTVFVLTPAGLEAHRRIVEWARGFLGGPL